MMGAQFVAVEEVVESELQLLLFGSYSEACDRNIDDANFISHFTLNILLPEIIIY